MLRSLHFRTTRRPYLRNENGIQQFSEMALGNLIRGVTKKSAVYREMNENLLVEKANLRMRAHELQVQTQMDAGEFFSVRRRLAVNTLIMTAVVVAGILLTFLALSAFINQSTGVSSFLSWFVSIVLSIVLVVGGLVAAERLVEALLPRRSFRTAELNEVSRSVAPLWLAILVAVELVLMAIAEVRADVFSSTLDSNMVYYGFIVLTMMLPIIAGAVRWDAMQYMELFKTTQAVRQIDSRLAQIDSILRQNEEYESNYYKMKSVESWDELNDFKTFKANYNKRKGITENLDDHFSSSYDAFQAEASKRYQSDIRDVNSPSVRKLNLVEVSNQSVGSKIGQLTTRPARPYTDGNSGVTEEGTYLSPQPIR